MGVLDAFLATWSKARVSFGDDSPQDGSVYDHSATFVELQADLHCAGPGSFWTGSASHEYAAASDRQARVLGAAAHLDGQLRAEVDRSADVVAAGRRDLDNVRKWVLDAASTVPPTSAGERMLYPVVGRGVGEIAEILERSHSDMTAIGSRIRGIGSQYGALGADLKLGTGEFGDDKPEESPEVHNVVGDRDEPWTYPFGPPPPPDSAPGGGRWEFGQAHPPGPGGGPPVGPIAAPEPWHRDIEPPVVGGTSGLQDVVPPPPNGWDVKPPIVLQEAYRFRVTGEGFHNADGHLRWVQRDGNWYQAQWIDYDLEAEHVRQFTGNISLPVGFNDWDPIDIKEIYRLQVENPRLPLYIPSPTGGVLELDPTRPTVSRPR